MTQNDKIFVTEADITSRCRAINKPGLYSILPSDNRVFSYLPGYKKTQAQILTASQAGARFLEYELFIHPEGGTEAARSDHNEQFFFVLEGKLDFMVDGSHNNFEKGSFCWLPPFSSYHFYNNANSICRAIWIRRVYEKIDGLKIPSPIISHETQVPAYPTDTYMEQHLTPYEDLAFDMGINLQVFEPGVYFSSVESHIMEHGLYMVEGQGVYWLNRDFVEVRKGDYIYMAPFCPQFFYATGWGKSAYLLYKDVNRDYSIV